ncbi:MAG: ATP-binding protein [Chloroflexi bacterium]|nr:ATP-binding protein [Chloroflexota bacterium]
MFLPLAVRGKQDATIRSPKQRISTVDNLLTRRHAIVHGEDRSGKTSLSRHLALHLIESSQPVLFLDLRQLPAKADLDFFRKAYNTQFHGDFELWRQQPNKTLIADNLSGRPETVDLLEAASDIFERIIITTSSTIYYAYYRDDSRLASFEAIEILPLTHAIQEDLIRKRLSLTNGGTQLLDGLIDQIEERINTVIVDDHIVPRYPFYVLCILQTYEAFMPTGMAISSYGHCYHALIVASLIRAGISRQDSDINACLNFAERLAASLYQQALNDDTQAFAFDSFVSTYAADYYMPRSMVTRLTDGEFGLLTPDGSFRTDYMYYFFLARHLAKGSDDSRKTIARMCDATYVDEHYLTLLFTIHHTNDEAIIDEILLRTMTTLDNIDVAKLDRAETKRFEQISRGLHRDVLSRESVPAERTREREARDRASEREQESPPDSDQASQEGDSTGTGIYRVWKNNEIMGQILRNRYGNITKQKIEEIVGVMTEGGLRLVNVILKDEDEIEKIAQYLRAKNPEYKVEQIMRDLRFFAFAWTMMNVEHLVRCVNVPEITESVLMVTEAADTPACDLVGYFVLLDSALELTTRERNALRDLLRRHDDPFVKGVLSIRTQRYMNTHRSKGSVEQSICSLLDIRYTARVIADGR